MKYTLTNGKNINIPDSEIENSMKMLQLSKEEAIQLYLEDNDYEVNEEQVLLQEKASKVKIKHGASAETKEKKEKKPRTVKISDEKTALFNSILDFLNGSYENVTVLNQNKLIEVKIGEKTFKIDLVERRPPKK